ncbi:storkhead-box protein 2 isoform X1 [Microplitis demolitor]|uniref:storkhead-box protein 2 isoform X1 n=1 Tax=Microplitis demolitor TaxID=69319 RepID=UPI0004CD4757|nr:storkhead-box protein 2 isoform X1 [Microplitis demolitor]XP_008545426.1 storkhead-box protein 2 isoform X1 [Microplitis demolitor]XP_014297377.1 storkhead-box protein 2 isoform X1 [Microplitis demolitor]XP_053593300.1 storkhead-box protein 2 isoform X1 [Microplitis demolitor]XP_053593301.1 storkhead-box protein 2 isoform X1 [Microplitis demolitor]
MASILGDGTGPGGPGSTRCLLLLQRSLAIQLSRGPTPMVLATIQHDTIKEHPADEMWMYDKGYNLFQSFLEANSKCWWNAALVDATRQLRYKGHVSPGVLMVGGPPCALEVLRAAWSRNVLRPPADHAITCLGDIEDCLVAPVSQGQFTPLPEALCWAILELTSQRQAATLDTLRSALRNAFPTMQRPNRELVYDALAKLMQERKIYHTSQGYFVVTPETKRLRRDSSGSRRNSREVGSCRGQGMLMSNDEAMALVHGEMLTLRDGNVTHQAVQTNLADVICGGNPNDKILFARCRSVPGRLERRHSLRLWGSARRLHRSGSSRSLPRRPERSDTSSSAEYASTDSAPHSPTSLSGLFTEKIGLLSRLFRRSSRRKGAPLMGTFSAQYPPTEWFNPRVVHLHSVATQTRAVSPSMMEGLDQSQASFQVWDDSSSVRSATLPRRHRRQPSGDSTSLLANSTPRSSRRHRSPCSTLPRSKCSSLSRCTSRASVLPPNTAINSDPYHQSRPQLPNGKHSSNSSPSRSGGSSGSVRVTTITSTNNNNNSPNNNNHTNNNNSLHHHNNSNSNSPSPAKTATLGRSSTRHSSRRPSHDSTGSGTKSSNSSPQHKILQKTSSMHSSTHLTAKSVSSGKLSSTSLSSSPLKTSITAAAKSSPLKVIQQGSLTPLQEAQNSITLQVSTNLSPVSPPQERGSISSSVTLASNASSTTTISGSPGTKIYVHQNNSPMRSVITFENGTTKSSIIDNKEEKICSKEKQELVSEKVQKAMMMEKEKLLSKGEDDKPIKKVNDDEWKMMKIERPSSLYTSSKDGKSESDKENKPKVEEEMPNKLKLTNRLNNSQAHLIDGSSNNIDKCTNGLSNDHSAVVTGSAIKNTNDAMNNSRKLSLSLSKDALSFRNLLHPGSKNNIASNPPSPTKSFDGFGGSYNNVYIENLDNIKSRRAPQGSEPNLDKSMSRADLYSYPSLSDMQVQFTSLAAQKILKGCPINSVDTLVEVNMAADKPNNRDVTVHTDFGLV